MSFRRSLSFLPLVLLVACATSVPNPGSSARPPLQTLALHGDVHGGQQPVTGSSLQLYAVGLSGGGSASTALLGSAVTTGVGGNFSITGTYTCPTAGSQVYIVARGGNPGLASGTNNSAIVLAAPLGPCGNLGASTFISINEVTTAAMANAVAPYFNTTTSIGSLPTDAGVLNAAFALANQYASTASGTSPGAGVVSGTTIPTAEINTIANILASCVNSSGGVAGDSSACGNLFSLVTAAGLTPPTDTFTAAVRLADNPALNTSALFDASSANAPFQPTLPAAPMSFSVAPAVVAGLQPSFTTAAFGSVSVGTAAPGQSLTLTNSSGSAVAISSLAISGATASDFSAINSCPASLLPGNSCTVQIGFTPLSSGRRVAELAISSDAPNTPLLIALSGIGAGASAGAPVLTSLSPTSVTAGAPNTLVTLNGTGFTNTTTLNVAGYSLTATYISPQAMSVTVPSSLLTNAGSLGMYVRNSSGTSATAYLTINNPVPSLTAISPSSVIAGASNFTLTLTGANLLSTSIVTINGVTHTPNVFNGVVTVAVAASEVASTGMLNVSATNPTPGGGASNTLPLQVIAASNRVRTLAYSTADIVTDPVRNVLYASVGSYSTNSPNAIIAVDPAQGTVIATQALPSTPDRIAVSDDGSYLYVSLYSAAKVERLSLPALTPDITWSIGNGGAGDLAVAPGHPHTVAVSTSASSGRTVTIYDDGVARPLNPATTYPTVSFDTLAWGADASTLYSTMQGSSGGPEFVLSVGNNGPTLAQNIYGAFGDFTRRLIYDRPTGRLYDTYGNVIDPATGSRVGVFNIQNTITYEQNSVAVDAAGSRAFVLNESYFSQQTTNITEDIQSFDLGTFSFLNAIEVPGLNGSRIVRWGGDGLAIGGGSQLYLLDGTFVSSSALPAASGPYVGVSPTITGLTPQAVAAGSGPVDVVITGKDFTPAVQATWNSHVLPVSWQSATQITVSFPASYLTAAAASTVTLTNGPGTESSNAVPFVVLPAAGPGLQMSALDVSGLEMAWDATRNLIWVAVTDPTAVNGNSVVAVDPSIPAVKEVIPTSYRPSTLDVTSDGKYLYVGFETLGAVRRYNLADLSLDLTIPLSAGPTNSNFAGDVKVAPGSDQTFAVSMGSYLIEPRDAGGLAIYDNATPRPNVRTYSYPDTYKLAWGKDATVLFAHSDPEFQPQGVLLMSVDSSGIGASPVGGGGSTFIGLRPHYDAATNLFYSDGGRITDPVTGGAVGQFTSNGWMVPDSALNRAYILRRDSTTAGYDLDIFDLRLQTLLKTISLPALSGIPMQILRWGPQGIAILTNSPGMMYVLQGTDISGATSGASNSIALSPAKVVIGAAAGGAITVNGSNFTPTSVVIAGGVQQATTYVSATQLTFQLSAAQAALPGYLSILVYDPASSNSASPSVSMEIDNPAPAITGLSATKFIVGSSDTSVTVTGTGFVPGTVVRWNGTALTTTYNNANSVTAAIPAADLAATGTFNLAAINAAPGGGVSLAVSGEVDNPAPVITSIPNSLATGTSSQIVQINGTGFLSSTTVQIDGTSVATAYVNPTQLRATVPAALLSNSGTLSFTAKNASPGGGTSPAVTVTVSNGIPGTITLSPSTVAQGATPPSVITVTGSNFIPGSVAQVGGQSRATTYISSTQLTFSLIASDQATTGTRVVSVVNPAPNGGASSALLTVAAAAATPVITSVNPVQYTANTGYSFLQVNGTGISSNTTILWNGSPLSSTAYSQYGYVLTTIPANLLSNVGTATIALSSPTATPQVSNTVTVSIVAAGPPTLTSVSPSYGAFNSAFTATLTGTNFTTGSVVSINGDPVPTTFGSSTSLTAQIPASEVVPGNNLLTVTSPAPGGGVTGAVAYTASIPQTNNNMVYDSVTGLFYLAIPGSVAAPYGNSITPLDPVTGMLGTPIAVGSEPNRMALSTDGRYLWVGLDGAGAVRKVDLIAGTAGLQFSLPQSGASGTPKAYALTAVPGQTDSVVVASSNPATLAIYDSGVMRGSSVATVPYSLQIDGTLNEIYAAASSSYQVYSYNAGGLSQKVSASAANALALNTDFRLQAANGHMFADNGMVVNAETGAQLAVLASPLNSTSSVAVDAGMGRAFVLDSSNGGTAPNRIQLFNTSDLSAYGTASIPVNIPAYTVPAVAYTGMTRWGTNGLAFRTPNSIYALRSNLVQDVSTTNADVGVSISPSGSNTTGTPASYSVQVTNNGPSTASEVRLVVMLPSTGVLGSVSTSAGNCAASSPVMCDLGSLNNGGTATITVVVNQLSAGTSMLTAQVSASQTDPTPGNNQASSTATITGDTYSLAPVVTSLSPSSVLAGSSDTAVTINGSGFSVATYAQLDGATLNSTVVSSTQMTAMVPASSIASLGWHMLSVTTPAPGGGQSQALPLTVYAAIAAGASRMIYDPFSRNLVATVGPSTPSGNSVEFISPETSTLGTPINVGDQPTRMALSDDGQMLYVLLTTANRLERFNMLTRQPEFSMKLAAGGVTDSSGFQFDVQPGSENTLALQPPGFSSLEIVDFDPGSQSVSVRPSTSGSVYTGSPRFLDASNVLALSSSGVDDFPVTATGIGTLDTSKISQVPNSSEFKIANHLLFTGKGGVADFSVLPARSLGSFPLSFNSTTAVVAPDPAIHRAFFLVGYDGVSSYSSTGLNGIAGFDTTTLQPTSFIPITVLPSSTYTAVGAVDVVRWGQDGVAALDSNGTIYLVRGPAVLPQLLQTGVAPALDPGSVPQLPHGAGNSVLALTGSGFQPGVAVFWNGAYRSTTYVDASHVSVDLPASDLTAAGTSSVTAANPGSTSSAAVTVTIN